MLFSRRISCVVGVTTRILEQQVNWPISSILCEICWQPPSTLFQLRHSTARVDTQSRGRHWTPTKSAFGAAVQASIARRSDMSLHGWQHLDAGIANRAAPFRMRMKRRCAYVVILRTREKIEDETDGRTDGRRDGLQRRHCRAGT